jgi:protein-disulfide isomerase
MEPDQAIKDDPMTDMRPSPGRLTACGLTFALLAGLVLLAAGPAVAQSGGETGAAEAPAMSEPAGAGAAPVTPAERARVESIVRDYLLENPEILLEAMQVLEAREREALAAREREALATLVPTLLASPMTPAFGPEDASAVMVEFFDYQCGYCKRILPDIQAVMEEDEELLTIFVEFPILSEASVMAARAALASQEQDLYLDYHAALMSHRGPLDEAVIFELADGVGLDTERLREDMQASEIDAYLQTVRGLAQGLNVRGTPTMVIGEEIFRGAVPADTLRQAIAQARATDQDGG